MFNYTSQKCVYHFVDYKYYCFRLIVVVSKKKLEKQFDTQLNFVLIFRYVSRHAEIIKINTFIAFLCLGVAGMCSKTTVAPLDRIKILLQAHSTHYKHLGVFSGLRQIVKKESFLALYKGNGAQMVRIFPYAAIQFTSFEIYKKVM